MKDSRIIIEPGETIEHGTQPRYRVTRPTPGGYAYWNVVDTSAPNLPYCATFYRDIDGAEDKAMNIADDLNMEHERVCRNWPLS